MSAEEKEKQRRTGNRTAGAQMVLAGLVLPLIFFGLKLMFFTEPELVSTIIVATSSLTCIGIGV